MSAVFNAAVSGGDSGGATGVERSVRLRASASAYFSRTPGTPTQQGVWAYSDWVKVSSLTANTTFIMAGTSTANLASIYIAVPTYQLVLLSYVGGAVKVNMKSSRLFRDFSEFFHLCVSVDMTQAVGSDAVRVWINGVQETLTVTTYIQGAGNFNLMGALAHSIGSNTPYAATGYFDGYRTETIGVDGYKTGSTPCVAGDFGQLDSNNIWVPKAYTGTYGNNGFHLDFRDIATTSGSNAGLGKDVSGNGNYWTTNNISVTAGVTYDSMYDYPVNGASGSSGVIGNYATLNPLDKNSSLSLVYAALTSLTGTIHRMARATFPFPSSGKWYFEILWGTYVSGVVGVSTSSASLADNEYVGSSANSWGYVGNNGGKYNSAVYSAFGATYTTNDVIGVAFDADNGKLFFSKNGTWQNSGDPVAGTGYAYNGLTSGPYFPAVSNYNDVSHANFGQRPFAYTPPTGFKALCTANLPTPVITNPSEHHYVATVDRSVSSSFTLPWNANTYDTLFWIKKRTATGTTDWYQIDGLRGYDKILSSNSTAAETTDANVITVSGTTITLGSTLTASATYVVYCWKAGLSASRQTNTDGSITSTVSRNVTAGFSIASVTLSGSAPFVFGHGLGAVPSMFVAKRQDGTSPLNWHVYHKNQNAVPQNGRLLLNDTAAYTSDSGAFGNTAPTSTTITLGSNFSTGTVVCYSWAEIDGYSKFDKYTGNGNADGPFAYCGARLRTTIAKRSDAGTQDWVIVDTARNTYNVMNERLYVDSASIPTNANLTDFTAAGIKIRNDGTNDLNTSSGTYIFAAFAEYPFALNPRAR